MIATDGIGQTSCFFGKFLVPYVISLPRNVFSMARSEHHSNAVCGQIWRLIAQRTFLGGRYTGKVEQESGAIARMIAQCAPYGDALKIFRDFLESLSMPKATFPKFSMGFCSDSPCECQSINQSLVHYAAPYRHIQ